MFVYISTYADIPENTVSVLMMDDAHTSALASMESRLRSCLSLVGVMSRLERPAGGFLSWDERYLVEDIPSEPGKVSKIVELLRKKTNEDFDRFCCILGMTGNEHLARELNQKVASYVDTGLPSDESSFDQKSFLKKYYSKIKTDMDAREIALELFHDDVIPEGVKTDIDRARDMKSANLLLYDHLFKQANLSSLLQVCEAMESAQGMDNMNKLGSSMREELEQIQQEPF
jgi:hypothetical protein